MSRPSSSLNMVSPTSSDTAEVEVVDARTREQPEYGVRVEPLMLSPGSDLEVSGDWVRVRKYSDAARQFGRAQVAFQILAGLELIELRKRYRTMAGRHIQEGCQSFGDLVAEHAGISEDSARRWVAMAEGVRPRLKKLDGIGALFRELLERPLHELTQEQQNLLEQTVHKVTDGMTQIEFLRELGIARLPAGHGAKGGDKGGRRPKKSLVPPSEEEMQAVARSDWVQLSTILDASRANFALLNDFEVESQLATLELHMRARKMWLRVPKKDRTAQTYEQISDLFRVRPIAPNPAQMTEAQRAMRPAGESPA